MLKRSFFLIILIFSISTSGQLRARPFYLNSLASDPRVELTKQWQEREELISLGKEKIALNQLMLLRDRILLYNIRNAPEIAVSILREIERSTAELTKKERFDLTAMAVRLAPDIAAVHFKAAHIYLNPSSLNLKQGIDRLIKGMKLYFSNLSLRHGFFINLAYWAAIAMLLTLLIFILILLIKYYRPLHHLFGHALPKFFSPASIALIIFALPVFCFLLFGPLSLILSVSVLFWIFYKPSEQVATILLLVAMLVLPFLFYLPSFPVKYQKSTERVILNVNRSSDIISNIEVLDEILQKNPDDHHAKLMLALMHKDLGNLRTALKLLREILNNKPDWDKPLVNIGNIEYINGRYNYAIAYYNRAEKSNGSNFLAKYNLGKALYKVTRIEEANQSLNRASNINSAKFKYYEDISDPKIPVKYVFDERITARDLDARINEMKKPDEKLRNNLWIRSALFNSQPGSLPIVCIVIIILLIALLKFKGKIIPPRTCEMCGKAFCKRCSQVSNYRDICSPCHYIFIIKEGTDEEFKVKKEKEESRNKLLQGIFRGYSSLILPGFGHIYSGNTFSGLILNFLFIFMLVRIILPGGLVSDRYAASLSGSSFMTVMLLIAALIIYVAANIRTVKGK